MTADRRVAIIRLLQTRCQHLPNRGRNETPAAKPGFTHGDRVRSCPDCLANGRRMPSCETCGGAGTVTPDSRAQLALVDDAIDRDLATSGDPYATAGQGFYHGGSYHDRAVALDHAIAAADTQLQRFPGFRPLTAADELAAANQRDEPWLEARRHRYARYDYALLDRALEQLRDRHEACYHVLHGVHVYGYLQPPRPGSAMERVAELGVEFVEERMRRYDSDGILLPIRAPAGPTQPDTAGETRNQRIARLVLHEGVETARVAAVEGLSVSQVNRVVGAALEGAA